MQCFQEVHFRNKNSLKFLTPTVGDGDDDVKTMTVIERENPRQPNTTNGLCPIYTNKHTENGRCRVCLYACICTHK